MQVLRKFSTHLENFWPHFAWVRIPPPPTKSLPYSALSYYGCPQFPGVPLKIAGAKPLQFSHNSKLMDAPSFQEFP